MTFLFRKKIGGTGRRDRRTGCNA